MTLTSGWKTYLGIIVLAITAVQQGIANGEDWKIILFKVVGIILTGFGARDAIGRVLKKVGDRAPGTISTPS